MVKGIKSSAKQFRLDMSFSVQVLMCTYIPPKLLYTWSYVTLDWQSLKCSCFIPYLPMFLQEVGMPADYVNKLARMFQDIKVSEDLNIEFKEASRNNNDAYSALSNMKIAGHFPWMFIQFCWFKSFRKVIYDICLHGTWTLRTHRISSTINVVYST